MSHKLPLVALAGLLIALTQPVVAPPARADSLLVDPLTSNAFVRSSEDARSARGLLRARARAVLSSEISGRIVALPYREGERFAAGEVIARIDCAIYEAQLQGAQAAERFAQRQLEQKRELVRLRAAGEIEIGLALARLEEAAAQSALQAVLASRCELRAPFSGAVVELRANPGETLAAGAPLIEIVDDSDFEIRILAPSSWLAWLATGQSFTFHLDEVGEARAARVEAIGASVDAGSQTILVVGRLLQPGAGLVPGMSGSARFAPEAVSR
jgi:membrane fusion protein, multidrug efflux system